MTEPCDLSAVAARRLIGARRLSPVELLESCIARIETVNPAVNAIVTTAFDRAREEAKAAEAAVMAGELLGLLHGLPAAIKDLNVTGGIRTTHGSPLRRDHVPTSDEAMISRRRRQGAIILGKTNTPEFGLGSNTTNRLFGPTANPFDRTRTAGGSSGGAGAALATGMVPIANGSDSGASIRNPAAFCGVSGIRPSPGLVPSELRTIGHSTNGVQGPLGRDVRDTALLLAAQVAYDPRDMLSRPVDPLAFLDLREIDPASLRVGWSEDLGFAPVDDVVRETFRRKLAVVSGAFRVCEEAPVRMANAERAYWGIRALYLLAGQSDLYDQHAADLGPNFIDNMEEANAMSGRDLAWALAEQTRIYRDFQAVFERYDVLITPASGVLPFPHATRYPTVVGGRVMRHYGEWFSLNYGISLVGHPAMAIPAGLDPQGTPFGLQLVGLSGGDKRLLEIGLALEGLFAGEAELRRPLPDIPALTAAPPLPERIVG